MPIDSILEYLAVALSLIYVFLASKEIKWCWFAGGLGSVIYVYINYSNNLIYDAVLQVYYVAIAIYAIVIWNKHEDKTPQISISQINISSLLKLLLMGLVLTIVLGFISLKILHQPTAFLDAGVTAFSFIATWMTARKFIESWLLWIAIDIAAALMYGIKELYPTTILYILFSVVAVYGYAEWKKSLSNANLGA